MRRVTTMSSTERALEILSDVCKLPREELTPEKHLIQDLDLDSVLALDLLMTLEESLGIEISEVEATQMVTVGDVLAFVSQKSQES
ncbi:MAG: acyl carrier protein [Planctomycetota bacterium]